MTEALLTDALETIQAAREALADGLVATAMLHLIHANRYHALASGVDAISLAADPKMRANSEEVSNKLRALMHEITEEAIPKRPTPGELLAVVREGLAPILRELATPQANPADVVRARAGNLAAILVGEFDIRKRHQ